MCFPTKSTTTTFIYCLCLTGQQRSFSQDRNGQVNNEGGGVNDRFKGVGQRLLPLRLRHPYKNNGVVVGSRE